MQVSRSYLTVFLVLIMLLAAGVPAARAVDQASLTAAGMPSCMTPGETRTVPVSVTNTGGVSWTSGTYMVSYHWEGPISIWDGIRTDLNETMKSQVVNAQLKAGNHQTGANLPAGAYTLKWQVLHKNSGWIQQEKAYPVEVKESCSISKIDKKIIDKSAMIDRIESKNIFLSDLAKQLDFSGAKPSIAGTGNTADLTQGGLVVISGRNFGTTEGKARMLGSFRITGSDGKALPEKYSYIDLKVDYWSDTLIRATVPDFVAGIDQEANLQVVTSGADKSSQWSIPFKTQYEFKLVPSSSAKVLECSQHGGNNYCNDYFFYGTEMAVHGRHSANCNSASGADVWVVNFDDGWSFHSWEMNTEGGPCDDPNASLVNWGRSIDFAVTWHSPGEVSGGCSDNWTTAINALCYVAAGGDGSSCNGYVGYLIAITAKAPKGLGN